MNKPIQMALAAIAVLTSVAVYTPMVAQAQYFGSGSEALSQEQLDKCEQYKISPCTQNNILAKERLIGAQNNPATGSGTPYLQGAETWAVIGALGAIFGGVAAAFFFKGRGSKPVAT